MHIIDKAFIKLAHSDSFKLVLQRYCLGDTVCNRHATQRGKQSFFDLFTSKATGSKYLADILNLDSTTPTHLLDLFIGYKFCIKLAFAQERKWGVNVRGGSAVEAGEAALEVGFCPGAGEACRNHYQKSKGIMRGRWPPF